MHSTSFFSCLERDRERDRASFISHFTHPSTLSQKKEGIRKKSPSHERDRSESILFSSSVTPAAAIFFLGKEKKSEENVFPFLSFVCIFPPFYYSFSLSSHMGPTPRSGMASKFLPAGEHVHVGDVNIEWERKERKGRKKEWTVFVLLSLIYLFFLSSLSLSLSLSRGMKRS